MDTGPTPQERNPAGKASAMVISVDAMGGDQGPAAVVAGLALSAADLAPDLARRQLGYGRGRRMSIEQDRAEILSGVRHGETLGSPITLLIKNKDWTNWQHTMSATAPPPPDAGGARRPAVTRPRPGVARN